MDIISYMRSTDPETARRSNPLSVRNKIREECRAYAGQLKAYQDTLSLIGGSGEERKRIGDEARLMASWMLKFGIGNEDNA
jgi:hypothetical protein